MCGKPMTRDDVIGANHRYDLDAPTDHRAHAGTSVLDSPNNVLVRDTNESVK